MTLKSQYKTRRKKTVHKRRTTKGKSTKNLTEQARYLRKRIDERELSRPRNLTEEAEALAKRMEKRQLKRPQSKAISLRDQKRQLKFLMRIISLRKIVF